MANSAPF